MEQGSPHTHRTSTILGAGQYLLRALAITTWAALALFTAVFWTLVMTDSVSDSLTLSRDGARPTGSLDSAVEAQTSLNTTLVTIVIQGLAVAGIAFVLARVRSAHPLHRLPTPSESRPRRWLYAAGIFAAAVLITAIAFDDSSAPAPFDAGPDSRPFSEIRTLLAGMLEEPFFSALPVLLLAALPARWVSGIRATVALTIAITVSAVGRALIHLYQGTWPAAAALCWGAAAVYLYYRYRVLLALIAVHTLWNLAVLTQHSNPGASQFVLLALAALAGAATITLSWPGPRPPARLWTPHEPEPGQTAENSKPISTRH